MTYTTPTPRPTDGQRLAYLDNLRTALTALVICHHAAIAYAAAGSWYYVAPPTPGSPAPVVLTIFTAVNQAFFMSLFFMVSAFFTPSSYDRKGPMRFLKDRAVRLGLPLLVYFFVLNPSLIYVIFRLTGRSQQGYLDFMSHSAIRYTGPGPLWFVMTLLVFAVLYVVVRAVAPRREAASGPRPLPTNRQILAFVIGVGVVTFVVRFWCPVGWEIMGWQLGYYPLYVCMYTFGVWAYRFSWLDGLHRRQVNLWFGASVVLIALLPVLMVLGGALSRGTDVFLGGASWQAYAYAAWEPVLCIGISMKLMMVFRDRLSAATRLTRSMASSAYTAYITHPYFVVLGTFLLAGLAVDPLVKFAALCPLAVACCFAVSDVIRRGPLLRRVL